jgi:hypothetical protein
MNPEQTEPMTPEQIHAALAAYNRKQQQQRERQARYYQRHADQRKAYAHEYYVRRKAETKNQPVTETPA